MQYQNKEIFPYPSGLLKYAVRLPIYLYTLGFGEFLGWLPLLVLTTRGRKSKQPRHVVLEYRRHGSKYYVISGWSQRPHWFKNLLEDPIVTIEAGGITRSARATRVENPTEAMQALYMFRRNSPIYEVILASMSSADTIDMRTLSEVAKEFTVVRLDVSQEPVSLQGVKPRHAWVGPVVLLSGFFAVMMLIRLVTKQPGDED